ncbi:hypothetical protein TNCV_4237461 [Trichonephila clavipes]|nr:hypothetical protein TNCV_4237461 [Trichonephila clavipes]
MRLVKGEEWCGASDHLQGVPPPNRSENKPNRTVTGMVLKAKANDRGAINLFFYNGAEIIKLDVRKRKRHFKVYGCYSPPGNTKLDFSLLTFTSKTILCGDFNAHSKRWNYSDLNSAGRVMEDLLIADQMEFLYNDSDIPTYLHYNGNGTNPDLTLASADIADDVEREVICDPGSGHRMIITGIGFDTRKFFKETL